MGQKETFSDEEVWVVLDYDLKGNVWLVTRSNLPGLHLQDETLEALVGKIQKLAPELIDHNLGDTVKTLPLHIDIPDSLAAMRITK